MKFSYKSRIFDIVGYSEVEYVYSEIKRTRTFYEIDLLEYILFLSRSRNGLIVDVGANIGNHSIFFGGVMERQVISVEPNPSIVPILERNLRLNNIEDNVFVGALGQERSKGTVSMPLNSGGNVGMAQVAVGGGDVNVITLDSLISDFQEKQKIENISVIKIDVEGMELSVLKGGLDVLKKYKPSLLVEIQDKNREQYKDINGFLENIGYQVLTNVAYTPVYHYVYSPSILLRKGAKIAKVYFKIKHQIRSRIIIMFGKIMAR